MDYQLIIQEKLHRGHKCICCILGVYIENEIRHERLIALNEGEGDHGLFCYSVDKDTIEISKSDLSLDGAFPITSDFCLYIDAQKTKVEGNEIVRLKINYEKNAFWFILELPKQSEAHIFLQDVKRCIAVAESNEALGYEPDFKWLEEYIQAPNPFLDTIDSPDEATTHAFNDWSYDIIHQQNVGSDCPIICDHFDNEKEHLPGDERSAYSSRRRPMGPRDDKIKYNMRSREDEYTDNKPIKILCATWNVNGQFPSEDCCPWLHMSTDPPDIYCIGFQELDTSASVYVKSDTCREPEWEHRVRLALSNEVTYKKVALVRLAGIMIILYAREELYPDITYVSGNSVVTGLMKMLGNKGGVAIRFELYDTSICFVNSHLAAHTDQFERRNQDFQNINSKMRFIVDQEQYSISDHDLIFWIGDLNYRFQEIDIEEAKMLIEKKDYASLFKYDQLIEQKRFRRIFLDYMEGEIHFPPTYKYDTGSDDWDTSEKCRTPAWCDRILWKGKNIVQNSYESLPEMRLSDHKPVRGLFTAQVKVINEDLYDKTYEDVMKMLDRKENLYLPQVSLSSSELHFHNMQFIESRSEIISITNIGQDQVLFEFKINELTRKCSKLWLNLDPISGSINVGDTLPVRVEVYIDKETAPDFNCGKDKIDDILILHLKGGKDFFITVNGSYTPSVYGSSIEALVQMFNPISLYSESEIIDFETNEALHPLSSEDKRPFDIPKELWRLVDHLNRHGLRQEDLFQHPGMHSEIQLIRDCLDSGNPSNIPGSIHSIAESLLLFLEAFSEPVIPFSFHNKCIGARSSFLLCQQVLKQIPTSHHNIFKYICAFLRKLLVYSNKNKLQKDTLAAQFGSLLLRSPKDLTISKQQLQARERNKAAFLFHFLGHNYK